MADLTNVNLNGTSYNFRDNTAIRGVKVNGVELTAGTDNKVNIVNDYLMKTTNINCRTLDQDSWYPVTFQLNTNIITLIDISVCDSLNIRDWSTHPDNKLISSHKKIEMLGYGWGVNYNPDLVLGRVSVSDCNYVQVDPIQKLGQIGQISLGYVYVRGGATYTFRLSGNITPVLHTEDYLVGQGTSYEQTLAVLTEVPNKLINITIANKSDIKDGVLTLQKNGVSVGTFSANQSSNKNINIEVPTKLSQLTDDVVTGKYLPLSGGTMLGDLNLGNNSLIISGATQWDNYDRSIPFSKATEKSKIAYYKDDFTYNPNTGVLKAGAFAKKGGTSSQFLKADGSVDSSTYLKSISVVDNNATLNYGEQDIIIGDIQGQKITVNMPDAPIRDISVVDSNPTLTWGQTKQVGTVDGKMLRVTMPANPNTDTHYTTGIVAGVSGTNANSATTNGNTYIKVTDNNTYRSQIKVVGTGATKVTSDATGVITINSTDTDTHYTTGITAGATGSTENSSVTNPFIKIKDNSVHRGQIQLKGGGDISVSSDSTGIITINGSNTKVTNANNHYTPTQNTAYNLPAVTENNCSFINQIYRDAKGHVTGISTNEVNFTTYGVDVTLETSTPIMSNFNANTNNYEPRNVLKFLLSMANYCVDNSYNKYCNGFISKVLLSNGDPTKTLTFSESVGSTIINTSTPIYFEFYCDNVIDFVNYEGDGVDAHATLYATVVDSRRRAGTSSCIITLDWKSGSSMELWAVFEPYIRCNGEKQSGFYYDNLDTFRDEISSVLIDEPKVDVVLNTSGAVTLLVEKMENIRGSRRLNIRLTGNKNEVELHINQYFILMNSKLNEVSIMMNFDEKGNFIDCSIS